MCSTVLQQVLRVLRIFMLRNLNSKVIRLILSKCYFEGLCINIKFEITVHTRHNCNVKAYCHSK
jgi:hypothetical protein